MQLNRMLHSCHSLFILSLSLLSFYFLLLLLLFLLKIMISFTCDVMFILHAGGADDERNGLRMTLSSSFSPLFHSCCCWSFSAVWVVACNTSMCAVGWWRGREGEREGGREGGREGKTYILLHSCLPHLTTAPHSFSDNGVHPPSPHPPLILHHTGNHWYQGI